jgi:nucleoside transporter
MTQLDYESAVRDDAKNSAAVTISLSIMMFLEFFVWGAWYVTMSTFMTQQRMTSAIGWAYMLCPIAAIISPFFLGLIADRFFASERVLAVLTILGGAVMFLVPAASHDMHLFLLVILVHALCYMPTLGLTNTIAFANMTNQEKQFPLVRVFGTLGWIVAGLIISFLGVDKTATPFLLAGGAAVIMGVFSLFLPHTPPPAKGKQSSIGQILGVDALSLLKRPSFLVFALASFLICIPLAAYYSFAGRLVNDLGKPVGSTMSIGQAAEVIFMLLMPLFFARLGVKWMLAVGMLSWVLRYALFAAGAPHSVFWMIITGIALHGMCYDFFFVTGFIYTDKKASKEIRGQAQGLLVLITQGLGLGIGAYLTGDYFNRTVGAATGAAALPLYPKFWWSCAGFALIVLIIFVAAFRDDSNQTVEEPRGFAVEPAQSGAA